MFASILVSGALRNPLARVAFAGCHDQIGSPATTARIGGWVEGDLCAAASSNPQGEGQPEGPRDRDGRPVRLLMKWSKDQGRRHERRHAARGGRQDVAGILGKRRARRREDAVPSGCRALRRGRRQRGLVRWCDDRIQRVHRHEFNDLDVFGGAGGGTTSATISTNSAGSGGSGGTTTAAIAFSGTAVRANLSCSSSFGGWPSAMANSVRIPVADGLETHVGLSCF